MASDEGHCALFAFLKELKENIAEIADTIRCAFGEGAMFHTKLPKFQKISPGEKFSLRDGEKWRRSIRKIRTRENCVDRKRNALVILRINFESCEKSKKLIYTSNSSYVVYCIFAFIFLRNDVTMPPLTNCPISVAGDERFVVFHVIKNIWLYRNDDIFVKKKKQASVGFALVSSCIYLACYMAKRKIHLRCTCNACKFYKQLRTCLNVHVLLSGGMWTKNSKNYRRIETLCNSDSNGMSFSVILDLDSHYLRSRCFLTSRV